MTLALGHIEEPVPNDLPRRVDDDGLLTADGAVEFKPETVRDEPPPIYRALAEHQQSEAWQHRRLLIELHRWAEIFNREFALGVPEFSLAIDRLRCTRLGHFREGHNLFGLKGEIVINRSHLDGEFVDVLGTLLHELLHGWQQAHGKPGRGNYHNKEFRGKSACYGLIIDARGLTQYEPNSRFFELLERYGIRPPELPQPTVRERIVGKSKLKRWSCACTNVRVAVRTFSARCLLCDQLFEPAERD